MIYIKTKVFRLLRYYSPAPKNIARRDWVTQNITHNMTSSIIQPYGLHSPLFCFIHEKLNFLMPYISLTTKKNCKESLTTIFCTVIIYLYISFDQTIVDVIVTWSQTLTDGHKRELVFLCTELYRTPMSLIHKNDGDQNKCHNFMNTTK